MSAITALLAAGLVGCIGGDPPATEGRPVRVAEVTTLEDSATIELTGTITSERQAALSAQVSGLVETLHVDAGHRVQAGDPLLSLDSALAALEVRRTQAAVERARARHDEAALLASATRAAGEALSIRDRGAAEAEAQALQADVGALQAELSLARELLARHTLRAPFDGVVSRRLTDPGEWVQTGTPVFELVAVDPLRLDLFAPQELYGVLGPDTAVIVSPSGPRAHAVIVPGRVQATVPVTRPDTRTFLVRVLLEDADAAFIPGMAAQARFRLPGEEAVGVPRDAIIRYPDGSTSVWRVVGDPPTVEQVQVQVAPGLDDVLAVEGLEPGDVVVVRGNERLRPGEPVRILDGGGSAP